MLDGNLEKNILEDKIKGLSNQEIGIKYNVNLKFIEKSIVRNLGINVSNPINIAPNTGSTKIIKKLSPKDFNLEQNTVWSFKSRGTWATHNGNYRGNWSPYIPRNIILRYSKEQDLVLDYFCGSGTTAVEAKLLNRNFIGIDINENAIKLAQENINFNFLFKTAIGTTKSLEFSEISVDLKIGDARDLHFINDNSIDLICSHPPYANIVQYTHNNNDDLSNYEVNDFINEIEKVAAESYRILRDGKYCSILIGDMRKNKNVIPLGFWTIEKYLKAGFILKELIIKRQHNCKTTGFWYTNSIKYNFLLLAHEYLAVFEKPKNNTLKNISSEKTNLLLYNEINKIEFIKNDNIQQESTTVWISDKENWLNNTLNNLIKRYSKNNYSIYNNNYNRKKRSDLLIYFYDKNFNDFNNNFDNYLEKEGIIAIICGDNRLDNNTIYSIPIHIEKYFNKNEKLKIKEIVVIQIKDLNNPTKENRNFNINHKYIMIYKLA
ncbi:MAG: methyltransferase domain-containing protein [Candidatus Acididesulfobacter guangdongensis]|uniref:Methyltransferase n=1 Tax=Acididesulfobacter guangdongensis TaxID=2597225 RepID=A0A519BH02_ACIG2|nr:MAG: methyltransferase domain-containing protein [Candidatus Acididesulfobacter guangdongensis]